MRKLKIASCLFGILSVIIFAGCLKNENTDAGPQGPSGKQGVPGGNLTGGYSFQPTLTAAVVSNAGAITGTYYVSYPFPTYIDSNSYLINVFINRIHTKEWYKLPQYNVLGSGDAIYATYGNKSIQIWYFNTSNSWPADSILNANVVIIPQQP